MASLVYHCFSRSLSWALVGLWCVLHGCSSILAEAAAFQCSTTLKTYTVKQSSLGSGAGSGIRCLQITSSVDSGNPYLVWYGEGVLGGKQYRQLGQAEYVGISLPLTASAAHFSGNGEGITRAAVRTLKFVISLDASSVTITGAWTEQWTLVKSTSYTPLPKPAKCGGAPFLKSYKAKDLTNSRTGTGLRCVLNVGSPYLTWYGRGNWKLVEYAHLATEGKGGYGSTDLSGLADAHWDFGYGRLDLVKRADKSVAVTGSWNELWTPM